ncbi:tail assembly chaperone E/41/14-like protein [Sinobacterium caligoides]|uniref:Tail assembly chaperone E/41/14-like protein n=1 Tax=Sinobacterium caligoides TaxID=933926 RepID=A0A3N2E0N5_9GAMM|nr:phage tail assembly protein [Sinobacterium caligoides]ROS05670.1 tail assembly chaperone E/41/14-like protein [Sinobacterium caligoides]
MSTDVNITLSYPITCHGEVITELHMRRPTVRDRLISERSQGTEMEKELRLLANLCELAPEYAEDLDMVDYLKLQEALSDFLS